MTAVLLNSRFVNRCSINYPRLTERLWLDASTCPTNRPNIAPANPDHGAGLVIGVCILQRSLAVKTHLGVLGKPDPGPLNSDVLLLVLGGQSVAIQHAHHTRSVLHWSGIHLQYQPLFMSWTAFFLRSLLLNSHPEQRSTKRQRSARLLAAFRLSSALATLQAKFRDLGPDQHCNMKTDTSKSY